MNQGQYCRCHLANDELEEILGVCFKHDCCEAFYCCKCILNKHFNHQNNLIQFSKLLEILAYNIKLLQKLIQQDGLLVIEKIIILSHISILENLFDYKKCNPDQFQLHLMKLKSELQFYEEAQKAENQNEIQFMLNLTRQHLKISNILQNESKDTDSESEINYPPENHQDEEVENLMKKGIELAKMKEYQDAVICFNQVISIIPNHYQALIEKAEALNQRGDFKDSLQTWDQAIKLNKYCSDPYIGKLNTLQFCQKIEESLECYNRAFKYFKNDPQIKYFLSMNHRNRHDFLYILDDYSDMNDTLLGRVQIIRPKELLKTMKSLQLEDEIVDSWQLLETVWVKEVVQYCDSMMKEEPNNVTISLLKGSALYNSKILDQALLIIDKVLEIEPDIDFAHFARGLILFGQSKYEEAIKCYDRALQINPSYDQANYNKGRALHQLKLFKEALQQYEQALLLIPKNTFILSNKGSALHQLKQYNEAINYFDEAIQIDSKNLLAIHNKGLSLYEIKCFEQALVCFNEILKIQPNFTQASFNKGRTFHKLLQYKKAIKYYNNSLYFYPDNALVYKYKGFKMCIIIADAQFAIRNYKQAIKNFQLAVDKGWDYLK